MSNPTTGIVSTPVIYGRVDYGPTFGNIYRPLNQRRIITAAGDDTIQPFDVILIYKKTVPAAFNVFLPDLALWMAQPYGGFDLTCKDGAGNSATYPITFVPFGTQTIDGVATGGLPNGGYQLIGNNGSVIFSPLIDKSGWITL